MGSGLGVEHGHAWRLLEVELENGVGIWNRGRGNKAGCKVEVAKEVASRERRTK